MNKTIYEAEFTKMVHDKMREANRFKEYERIPKNRIGGDYLKEEANNKDDEYEEGEEE